jgi:hypothetical protein
MAVLTSLVQLRPAPRREAQPAHGSLQGPHHGDGRELYELTPIPSSEGRLEACRQSISPLDWMGSALYLGA